MLSVHDILLNAEILFARANAMALGTDRCAAEQSGLEPWQAKSLPSVLPYGFTAVFAA